MQNSEHRVQPPISSSVARAIQLLKRTVQACMDDKTPELGAALAFYTLLSLAPLTLIALAVVGFIYRADPADGWSRLTIQLGYFMDANATAVIQDIARSAAQPHKGIVATGLGLLLALVGASGVFLQLQSALNTVWKVKVPKGGGLSSYFRGRILAFSLVAGIAFVLLVSLVLESVLQGFSRYAQSTLPAGLMLARVVYILFDLAVVTALFALIFKLLPKAQVRWHEAWVGAGVTSILFFVGKWLLSFYLASGSSASAYGAAGALVTLLLWIYYSSQIFLFGAELTRGMSDDAVPLTTSEE